MIKYIRFLQSLDGVAFAQLAMSTVIFYLASHMSYELLPKSVYEVNNIFWALWTGFWVSMISTVVTMNYHSWWIIGFYSSLDFLMTFKHVKNKFYESINSGDYIFAAICVGFSCFVAMSLLAFSSIASRKAKKSDEWKKEREELEGEIQTLRGTIDENGKELERIKESYAEKFKGVTGDVERLTRELFSERERNELAHTSINEASNLSANLTEELDALKDMVKNIKDSAYGVIGDVLGKEEREIAKYIERYKTQGDTQNSEKWENILNLKNILK